MLPKTQEYQSWVSQFVVGFNVREYPSDEKSEESYIRNSDIQRVSIVENEDKTISVLVHALGGTYLATISETLPEAMQQMEYLVLEISE